MSKSNTMELILTFNLYACFYVNRLADMFAPIFTVASLLEATNSPSRQSVFTVSVWGPFGALNQEPPEVGFRFS